MVDIFTRTLDRFFGRGDASIAIPPMDGALKPNNAVDDAKRLAFVERPDNLVRVDDGVLFSSGRTLLRLGAAPEPVLECEGEILATACRQNGLVAIFDDARGLSLFDLAKKTVTRINMPGVPIASVTAAAFNASGDLIVCVGSAKNPTSAWQRDVLESEAAGSVWLVNVREQRAVEILGGLAYPAGCLLSPDGDSVLVSESWSNRLVLVDLAGSKRVTPVLTALPGYPARLSSRAKGGAWLSFFAPRNQLVEFVRREPQFRRDMMAEMPPEFWIAPALASGASFAEPMQGGALKQMGILKPWAPTRSYGLVVALNKDYSPSASYHSRAGGRRHGLTSAVERSGKLIVASKGGGELVSIDIED